MKDQHKTTNRQDVDRKNASTLVKDRKDWKTGSFFVSKNTELVPVKAAEAFVKNHSTPGSIRAILRSK